MNYHEKSKKILDAVIKNLTDRQEFKELFEEFFAPNPFSILETEHDYKDMMDELQQVIFDELVKP